MGEIVLLTTTKKEKVLVNFDNVVYCHKTNNKHTSLKFKYSAGRDLKGAYLVVLEGFDEIKKLLG